MKNNCQASNTIKKLQVLFSRFGLPQILVSDNAPQLTKSLEFERFCKQSGITHIPIPSYHPSSNGQAERVVGMFKKSMIKMCKKNTDVELKISQWLLNYYNTPHSYTGIEPSVLMIGRRLRSPLSLVNPLSLPLIKHQAQELTERIESDKTLRKFLVGDSVLYRDVLKNKWYRGTIKSVSDKVYELEGDSGSLIRKHIDHIVRCTTDPPRNDNESNPNPVGQDRSRPTDCTIQVPDAKIARPKHESTIEPRVSLPDLRSETPNTRPKREAQPPNRLGYDKLGG